MGRKKSAFNVGIRPWLSARADCKEGRFIQVGNTLLLSKQYQALSGGAKVTYLGMAMESAGYQKFFFTHGSAKKYGIASSTYDRAIKELQRAGFISQIIPENHAQFARNQFQFSYTWKDQN